MTMIRLLPPGTTKAQDSRETGVSLGLPPGVPPTLVVEMHTRGIDAETTEVVTSGTVDRSQIQIGSLLDHRLRMLGPVTLELEQEGEFYVARFDDLDEYGYGFDPISAVQDVRKTIAELYWQLKDDQDRLGPDLARTWQRLTELVYEV